MRAALVDTNVLSELLRPAPNAGVVAWSQSVVRISVSVVTVEELAFGLTAKPNARLEQEIESMLSEFCDILPATDSVAQRAGKLRGHFRREGVVRTAADMFIAATALEHGLDLVTRNEKDFRGCGLRVLNPFV